MTTTVRTAPKAPKAAPKAPTAATVKAAPKASKAAPKALTGATPAATVKAAPRGNGAPPRPAAASTVAAAPKAPAVDVAALVATIEGMKGTIADLQGKLSKAASRGPKIRDVDAILSGVDVDAVLSDDDPRRDWHGVQLPIFQFSRKNGEIQRIENLPPCTVLVAVPSDDDKDGARKRATGCLMAHFARRADGTYEGEGEDMTIDELNALRAD